MTHFSNHYQGCHFKTQNLPFDQAQRVLNMHMTKKHPTQVVSNQGSIIFNLYQIFKLQIFYFGASSKEKSLTLQSEKPDFFDSLRVYNIPKRDVFLKVFQKEMP